jgi:uncharacterized damage-inducible protein DinB
MNVLGRSEPSEVFFSRRMMLAHRELEQAVAPLRSDMASSPDPSGEWSAGQVLAHVSEFLRYWWGQVELLIQQPGADFGRPKQDSDRVAWVADRGGLPLRDLLDDLDRAVQEVVPGVLSLTDADLEQPGQHFRRGRMTVREVTETFLVEHMEEHLAQLRAAVGAAQDSEPSADDRDREAQDHG